MKHRRVNQGFEHPVPSEVTAPDLLLRRRQWVAQTLGWGLGAWLGGPAGAQSDTTPKPGVGPALHGMRSNLQGAQVAEVVTEYRHATAYNNFYEFGLDKTDPAKHANKLKTRPWSVSVEGLVNKPRVFDWESLLKLAPMEERTYRLRCVEGWSMVIPWVGYSLDALIRAVEPQGSAKFVQFESLANPEQMPGLRERVLNWPYVEGLRMDEARHPLTMLAFGMYSELMPPQNGAPLRLVVPWKYGFKSAKSLVRIRFVERMPRTAWNEVAPGEYGFFSNVNPDVPHPRWSQATERRIGEEGGLFAKRRKTLLFNGYEAQVGQLYTGMDLRKWF